MATAKQAAANRRNAARSTGPQTTPGKQVARMNALKHGLQTERVVIPGEDPEEFEALYRDLEEHYQPVGSVEALLVERITHCTWRLQRLGVIETAIMREEYFSLEKDRASDEMGDIKHAYNYGSREYDLEEPDPDDASGLEAYADAFQSIQKAEKRRNKAEDELKDPLCTLAVIFANSTTTLETLSRYETTLERRLRNAMQDLERLQADRKAEAAAAATVIDITELDQDKS